MKSKSGVSTLPSAAIWTAAILFISMLCATALARPDTTIGIDLGTTYSCVGVFKNGKIEIIANDQGNRITPSYVAFSSSGERLIGEAAKNQATLNPENTIFDIKRLIGRMYGDKEVQFDRQRLPYKVVDHNGRPYVEVVVNGTKKQFSAEEVSAMIITKMKETAEAYLGRAVHSAVITVPAYFNDAQRQATKDAGTIAGLSVERIINEPTAAAIAYGLSESSKKERNVLVFDLGGGTFDVSLLTMEDGVTEVIATSGDTHLGGEDFDRRVIDYMLKLHQKKTGVDCSINKKAVQKLRKEAERVKRSLSTSHQETIEVDAFCDGSDLRETLSRAKFEELNMDLFKKTLGPVQKVLDDSGIKKKQIDEIVLVGGSTRIPKVQQLLKEFFDGKELNQGINPDESVAYGAAVQGSILSGDHNKTFSNVLLIDVTPLSLGIETVGGVMSPVIKRNSAIPTTKTQVFSTAQDNQPTVTIKVFEGERAQTKNNHLLGNFDLDGIPPAPRGKPQIEVKFEIDANGLLHVSAKDLGTGKETMVKIDNNKDRLTEEEIQRMVKEAEEFAEDDARHRAQVDATNKMESYLYHARSSLDDDNGKISDMDKEDARVAIKKAEDWLESNADADTEDVSKMHKEVDAVLAPIFSGVYKGSEKEHGADGDESI